MPLPLIALAATILPDLVRLLSGSDRAGGVAESVAEAVRRATGTDDPEAARVALDADPAAVSALRVRLAEIALDAQRARDAAEASARAAEADETRARLGDLSGARASMGTLAAAGHALAWGPAAVSVVGAFFAILALLVTLNRDFAPETAALVNVAVGALGAAFAAVVNFWIGSSQGSREKDRLIAAGTEAATAAIAAARASALPAGRAEDLSQTALSLAATGDATDEEARFDACLGVVLEHEGGWSDNPADPGGATNLGITLRTLRDWRDAPALGAEAVRRLTRGEAREIYRARYWLPMRCGALPAGFDLAVFDFGVNAGPSRSVRLAQGLLGVRADGAVGPVTLAAARAACATPARRADLLARFAEGRMAHYRALPTWPTFGRGWSRRTDAVTRAALAMATGSEAAEVNSPTQGLPVAAPAV